jgi:hypothetical protein
MADCVFAGRDRVLADAIERPVRGHAGGKLALLFRLRATIRRRNLQACNCSVFTTERKLKNYNELHKLRVFG